MSPRRDFWLDASLPMGLRPWPKYVAAPRLSAMPGGAL